MKMRFIYLCSSLISCLFIVSCGDEECHPGFKPFFNGKGQVIESLERVDCFFEKSYYSEGDDLEYLFFCYAYLFLDQCIYIISGYAAAKCVSDKWRI